MEGYRHFSHPHNLSFHQRIEGAKVTCTGCKFPCTGTAVYSCRTCGFFLHDKCFRAARSLIHPSHPEHPLSLYPSPTYKFGSFSCNLCKQNGSGFCFCCAACDFDLHIHCAYNTLNPKPKQIKLKSHPNHQLKLIPWPPSSTHACNVCGTSCHPNNELYRCETCDYDAHVACTSLPETIQRKDHVHALSLLYVNPYAAFECDVCGLAIKQKHCMYLCSSNCSYGMHVKCASAMVSEKAPVDELIYLEAFKLQGIIARTSIHDKTSR